MVFVITTQLYCYNTEAPANHMEYSHKILLRKKQRAVRDLADRAHTYGTTLGRLAWCLFVV